MPYLSGLQELKWRMKRYKMKQRKVVLAAILGRTGIGILDKFCKKDNLCILSGTREYIAIPLEYFCCAGLVVL